MAAAGPFTFFDTAVLWEADGSGLLVPTNAFTLALCSSAQALTAAGQSVYADLTAELATGNGYTLGGVLLTGVTLARTGGTAKFTATGPTPSWTASGTGIPAWRYGVLYVNATLNGHVKPLVGFFLGDSTPADVPLTAAPNTIQFTPNASGIGTITHSP